MNIMHALRWIAGSVVALALVLAGGAWFLTTQPGGQGFIAAKVLEAINGGDVKVAVGGTSGTWPQHIVLNDVVLRDAQGVWATIDRLEVHLHPAALLRGHADVDALMINAAHVLRLPVSPPAAAGPAKPFDPTATLRTMDRVVVRRAEIAALQLDAPVMGRAQDLKLTASLMPDNGTPHLIADIRQRNGSGRLALDARADRQAITGKLDGALDVFSANADVRAAYAGEIGGSVHVSCTESCLDQDDVKIGTVSADVTLAGTTKRPALTVTATIENIKAAGRTVRNLTAAGPVTVDDDRERTLHVDLTGTLHDAREAFREAGPYLAESATWSLRGRRTGATTVIEALTVQSNGNDLAGSATFTPDGVAPADLTLNLRGGGGRYGGPSAAKAVTHAELKFARALKDGTADGTLHVQITGLAPQGQMALVLGKEATVDGTLAADPKGLRITAATLKSGALTLRGDSTWIGPREKLVHQTSNMMLRVETQTPAQASLVLAGPIETVTAKLQANLADVPFGGTPAQGLTLNGDGKREGKGFSATLSGSGKWRDQPVDLQVQARKTDTPVVTVSKVHFASAAAVLDGALQIDTATNLTTGNVGARFADLGIIGPLVGTPLAGSGDLTLTLARPGDKQRVDVALKVKDFKQKTFTAETLTASALVEDAFGAAQVRARLDSTGGALLERPLKTATFTATGPRDDLSVMLNVAGAAKAPLNAAIMGRVGLTEAITVSLARLRVQDGDLVAQLQAPTKVIIAPEEISLAPTRIAIAGGTISGDVKIDRARDTTAGTFAFDKISLSAFAAEAPTIDAPTNTLLDGRIVFSGPATDATVNAAFDTVFDTADGKRGRLDLKAVAQNGRAQITGSTGGISPEPARLTADVPVRINLADLRLVSDMDAPMSGDLTWRGDIRPIWRLVPVDDHVLGGPVSVDLKASGTFASPRVQGEIKMTDGTYENVPQSTILQHVNASLTADSVSSFAFTLAAADRRGGTIKGQGRVTRDDEAKAWVADISATLANLMALNRDDVAAAVTGDVTYKGPLGGGTISGKIEATRAEFRIDQTGPPPVPLLRAANATEAEARNPRTGKAKAPPPQTVKLDIRVGIDEPIRVDGRGLTSWWRGSFVIGGTIDAPDIVGQMEVDRGSFSFIGQTFTLESGKLTFTGGGRIDPDMNIIGTRETTDIVATVTLTGTTTSPQVELSSRPALPQDEVLARLLFQKSSTQLGPIESVQLASAAAELAGISRGGLGGALQRTFGVDQVSFGGSSGSAVVVGQQVGRNLYVGVEQNLKGTGRQIVLEWRFKKGFSLRSATSDETGSDIGISWRKDY